MRLFFALWPDEHTSMRLRTWALALSRRHGGRPVALDDLHLTLAFLGEQAPSRLDALIQVASALKGRSFRLSLDQAGFWPHLLWCAPDFMPPELLVLQADLASGLRVSGFPVESRPFAPHVSLVRNVRDGGEVGRIEPLHWQVDEFCLAVSEPQAAGAHYRIIGRWPLQPR